MKNKNIRGHLNNNKENGQTRVNNPDFQFPNAVEIAVIC